MHNRTWQGLVDMLFYLTATTSLQWWGGRSTLTLTGVTGGLSVQEEGTSPKSRLGPTGGSSTGPRVPSRVHSSVSGLERCRKCVGTLCKAHKMHKAEWCTEWYTATVHCWVQQTYAKSTELFQVFQQSNGTSSEILLKMENHHRTSQLNMTQVPCESPDWINVYREIK